MSSKSEKSTASESTSHVPTPISNKKVALITGITGQVCMLNYFNLSFLESFSLQFQYLFIFLHYFRVITLK